MSDHIEIYNELRRVVAQREEEAQALGDELRRLDQGFRAVLEAWVNKENERLAQLGYSEDVSLALEEPVRAPGFSVRDWQASLPTPPPSSSKLRYYIAYRPRVIPGLAVTYVIIFSYAFEDLGGGLQLIRCEPDTEAKMHEMFPKVLGETEDGHPAYTEEMRRMLDKLLSEAAMDYRDRVLELAQPLSAERQVSPLR
ncbi:hypothetical protein IT575_04070 [bacterium]|nr:hypothetical protein [bacterium]